MKAALQTNHTVRLKKERIAHSFIGLPSEAKIPPSVVQVDARG